MRIQWVVAGLLLDRAELGGQGWGRGGGGRGRGREGYCRYKLLKEGVFKGNLECFFIGLEANIIEGVPFNGKGEVRDIFKVFKSY